MYDDMETNKVETMSKESANLRGLKVGKKIGESQYVVKPVKSKGCKVENVSDLAQKIDVKLKRGKIIGSGKYRLVSKITSLDELYDSLNKSNVIFNRHRIYASGFILPMHFNTLASNIKMGWLWKVELNEKSSIFSKFRTILKYAKFGMGVLR